MPFPDAMIAKSNISQNLDRLDSLFKNAKGQRLMKFYSKLAIMEFGGWIEMTMDDIILRHSKRLIKDPVLIKEVEKVVKKTYGFEFDRHFQAMIVKVIGLVGYAKLIRSIDGAKIQVMSAALNTFKEYRDKQAHTYTKGVTTIIQAPSVTKGRLNSIYEGLVEIDRGLKLF